jgi:putative nucleotidyltransferase with HDIG domain
MPQERRHPSPRPRAAAVLAAAALGLSVLLVAVGGAGKVADPLTVVLVAAALLSEALSARLGARWVLSGWDWCYVLALVFLGPVAAIAVTFAAFLGGWLLERYRLVALLVNVATVVLPIAIGGLVPAPHLGHGLWLGAAAVTAATFGSHIVLSPTIIALLHGARARDELRALRDIAMPLGIQGAIALTIVAVEARYGLESTALALVLVVGFAYMLHLLVRARERTRAYANLSWGVLSALVRTLDARDARAARHCAAVARFSRDIAREAGFGDREQELAHTAGLLHDIGKFALSDRVMERAGELTEEDWRAIRRHPEIGAELLKDVGVYGPVAEIVRAHHERIDGRGYPDRLAGVAIPPLARIVAVAEVYDTLTAPDTYRSPMTSFEALNELRRVAGSQLDATYVEALAAVLAGQDTSYRHAGEADFDRELDIQRRLNEAAAG